MINIVLFQPEIPFNTANIIRTCVAGNMRLHIIKPIGFDLTKDHKDLKRGSTNFLNDVDLTVHESFDDFRVELSGRPLHLLTRYGKKVYSEIEVNINEDIYVMFGRESSGIEEHILKEFDKYSFRIPMNEKMRSLNLSNCVALVGYDLLNKTNFEGLSLQEPIKNV